MILVVGASGVLGGTTARFLLARGRGVRAMTRRADALGPLRQLGADIVSGELKTGRAQILGPGVRQFNLVAVDDVAAMIALVVDRPEARGADVPVGGPENLTQRAIADTIARITGRPARYSHVPMAMLRAAAVLAPAFNSVFARQAKVGVLMNTEDNTFDMRPLLAQYPIPQTTLEEWARRRYAAHRPPSAASRQPASGD
jgi:uncharacterized protein YbjT (DUF2867 family)